MKILIAIWRFAKRWRTIEFGPISLIYRIGRTTHVSNNSCRRMKDTLRHFFRKHPMELHTTPPKAMTNEIKSTAHNTLAGPGTALVVGVGPGLGFALARKLASAGMRVALASRNAERLDLLVEDIRRTSSQKIKAYGCDATDEVSVKKLISIVSNEMEIPHLVIYSIQSFGGGRTIDIELPAFEEGWRHNCLGAFIVAREAARKMVPLKRGTIVLVGSTSGVIGRAGHLNLAVGKFGLRALSQVMARELWPDGIHVVHAVIDADISEDSSNELGFPQAYPEDISELIFSLHCQPKSAWTSEVDVRPWNETFWEHC